MFTRLKALKVEIEHLQLLMDKAKVKLQKEFEAWWTKEASRLQVWVPGHAPCCPSTRPPAGAWGPWGQLGRGRHSPHGAARGRVWGFNSQAHVPSAAAHEASPRFSNKKHKGISSVGPLSHRMSLTYKGPGDCNRDDGAPCS